MTLSATGYNPIPWVTLSQTSNGFLARNINSSAKAFMNGTEPLDKPMIIPSLSEDVIMARKLIF